MDKRFKAYVAGRLRTFRRKAGVTQEQLGSRIGRTGEAISNIERGKSIPSLETLVALTEVLEVPLRDFVPNGPLDDNVSQNRLKLEAEAMSMLRGLSDNQLHVALAQIKALGEL